MTRNRSFHLDDNEIIKVPTMATTIETPYYNGHVGRMISLPYEGDNYNMYIFLPKTTQPINMKDVTQIMSQMQTMKVKILLPKFRLSSFFHMERTLSDMGLEDLFGRVDVMEDDIFFSDILHKVRN